MLRLKCRHSELRRPFAHQFAKCLNVLHRRLRQDPMSKIKNMPGSSASLTQNILGARLEFLPLREQQHRIKIPLHRAAVAQAFPPLIQRNAPVEANHLRARFGHKPLRND